MNLRKKASTTSKKQLKTKKKASLSKVEIIERGWAGHFIGAQQCEFKRNTLLQYNKKAIVVSTVGMYRPLNSIDLVQTIGFNRYYETMAFEAIYNAPYWDGNIHKEITCFTSPCSIDSHNIDDDLNANVMHETIVKEISEKLLSKVI